MSRWLARRRDSGGRSNRRRLRRGGWWKFAPATRFEIRDQFGDDFLGLAAGGAIADGDDLDAKGRVAEDAAVVKETADLHSEQKEHL